MPAPPPAFGGMIIWKVRTDVQLTYHTDYSLRVLMYLAVKPDRLANIREIAERYNISRNHLVKVVHHLARGGFVKSHRGNGGGIELARKAGQINIGQVVRYMEGPLRPVECFDSERNRCVITAVCDLAQVLQDACDSFLATLDKYTLAELVKEKQKLGRALEVQLEIG
jgi:Rrf2 family transcriptional regulator, nitric oxide-sensitive transcriptional repressor